MVDVVGLECPCGRVWTYKTADVAALGAEDLELLLMCPECGSDGDVMARLVAYRGPVDGD